MNLARMGNSPLLFTANMRFDRSEIGFSIDSPASVLQEVFPAAMHEVLQAAPTTRLNECKSDARRSALA